MKKIITILSAIILTVSISAQNKMHYTSKAYQSGVINVTDSIDFDYMVSNQLINAAIGNIFVDCFYFPDIRNLATNKRVVTNVMSNQTNWSESMIIEYEKGNYTVGNYYQSRLYDLYFHGNFEDRYELILRIRSKLNGTFEENDKCIGINQNGKIIAGYYRGEIADGVVLRNSSGEWKICDPNTVCHINEYEENYFN